MNYDANVILPFIRKPVDNNGIITEDTRYYLDLFEKNLTKNKYIKWNWSAALFGPSWFIYRSMPDYAFAWYVLWFFIEKAISTGQQDLKNNFIAWIVVWLINCIVLGFYGNALYISNIKNKIDRDERPPESGVSPELVWLTFIIPLIMLSK